MRTVLLSVIVCAACCFPPRFQDAFDSNPVFAASEPSKPAETAKTSETAETKQAGPDRDVKPEGTTEDTAPHDPEVVAPPALSEQEQKQVASMNDVSLRLFRSVLHGSWKGENTVMSPFSVSQAMALACLGADGNTAKQIVKTLEYSEDMEIPAKVFSRSKSPEVNMATGIWLRDSFKPEKSYVDDARRMFDAEVSTLDFTGAPEESLKIINGWFSEKTRKQIPSILEKLEPTTVALLGSAVYFKGKWVEAFSREKTKEEPFFTADGKTVNVPMMSQKNFFDYAECEECQIVSLPYQGESVSMMIFLPGKDVPIKEFVSRFDVGLLKQWEEAKSMPIMDISIPRLEIESTFSLSETLQAMGITDAFTTDADFGKMTRNKEVMLSQVDHRAKITLDEEGTEAAAATSVGVVMKSGPARKPVVFKADRPFLFLIRNSKTGVILFVGLYQTP